MSVDLFAGIAVSDYATAITWYEKLLGTPPAFFPNDVEAVWEIAEHRYVYIEHLPDKAGHAIHTLFLDDFDERIAAGTIAISDHGQSSHSSVRIRSVIGSVSRSAMLPASLPTSHSASHSASPPALLPASHSASLSASPPALLPASLSAERSVVLSV